MRKLYLLNFKKLLITIGSILIICLPPIILPAYSAETAPTLKSLNERIGRQYGRMDTLHYRLELVFREGLGSYIGLDTGWQGIDDNQWKDIYLLESDRPGCSEVRCDIFLQMKKADDQTIIGGPIKVNDCEVNWILDGSKIKLDFLAYDLCLSTFSSYRIIVKINHNG